jgi:hypothetical protein
MDASTYRCRVCALDVARNAVVIVRSQSVELRLCPTCRGPVQFEQVRVVTPIIHQYLHAMLQPVWGWNSLVVVGVTAAISLASFAPMVGKVLALTMGFGFLLRVVAGVAAGEDRLGELLVDFTEPFSKWMVIVVFARAASSAFWGLLPTLLTLWLLAGSPMQWPVLLPSLLFGLVYTPASVACVAVTGGVLWNPVQPARMINAARMPYLMLLGALLAPLVGVGVAGALVLSGFPFAPFGALLAVAAATVAARMVGLFVREYWDEISD